MAWCWTSDKQSPEPMMTLLTEENIDGSVQERCNSIANALELHFSCTNPSICHQASMCELTYFQLDVDVILGMLFSNSI